MSEKKDDKIQERYLKWVKGDRLGVVEKVKGTEEQFTIFESGYRLATDMINEFMMDTTADDPGVQNKLDEVTIPSTQTDTSKNTKDQMQQKPQSTLSEQKLSKLRKLLKLSDGEEKGLSIKIPDEKTELTLSLIFDNPQTIIKEVLLADLENQLDKILSIEPKKNESE